MNHLSDAQLYSLVFDAVRSTGEETTHLEECSECRSQLVALRQLADELAIARRSQPSAATLASYAQLFAHVQQQPSPVARFVQNLRATLAWDSRQQSALQGVRSGAATQYRQLYTTDRAEIELWVTARTLQRRDIEGELITQDERDQMTPVLLQLQNLSDPSTAYEAESDVRGRFRITNLTPGRYQLVITPAQGALLEIDELEIA